MNNLSIKDLQEGLAVTCLLPAQRNKVAQRVHANVVSWVTRRNETSVEVQLLDKSIMSFDLEDVLPSDMGTTEDRFANLATAYNLALSNDLDAVLVSGNPSLGKSHVLYEVLTKLGYDTAEIEKGSIENVRLIKGKTAPTAMYEALYRHSQKGQTVIFDDCDDALKHKDAVKLLKAALDTTGTRVISWDSIFIKRMGLPTSFVFEGSIIFITNTPPEGLDSAVMSRCYFADVFLRGAEYQSYFIKLSGTIAKSVGIQADVAKRVTDIFAQNITSFSDDAPLMRLYRNNCKAVAALIKAKQTDEQIMRFLSSSCKPFLKTS
jgi:hypothetical protein